MYKNVSQYTHVHKSSQLSMHKLTCDQAEFQWNYFCEFINSDFSF